jgi:hypothetical protein
LLLIRWRGTRELLKLEQVFVAMMKRGKMIGYW